MSSVAVIDIGSNSIKVLVALQTPGGRLAARKIRTIEARISAGISADPPRLGPEGMARGVAAVKELAEEAAELDPDRTLVVATSAVRDAANGEEFCAQILAATGLPVRILSGDEEAHLIGRGLLCDPALAGLVDFYVFDLGGGSLECLAFHERAIAQAVSLPLGCVRLTEKFVADPARPFPAEAGAAIAAHVRAALTAGHFSLAATAAAIGTGGTLTTVRSVLAARTGQAFDQVDARLPVAEIRAILARIGPLPLSERKLVPGISAERADVFPAALATLIALADLGGFDTYTHSLYNLRWGLAAEALAGL
jgi:exopolyphosphatase/guanosine-5'-triphosphate,3'-diphosphate pyrophosphatase